MMHGQPIIKTISLLYGAESVVCYQVITKHINTVWTERTILEC
jgi:hypothetical protein